MRADILTHSGIYFDFINPRPDMIRIEDIAHALSNCARFCGHAKRFYSVAEHSMRVSTIVPSEHALQALLHDATEAYIGDMTKPLKALLPEYRAIEARIWRVIASKFGIDEVLHDTVKHADLIMLATEQRDLMPPHDDEWACIAGITPLPRPIPDYVIGDQSSHFLRYFRLLNGIANER